MEKTEKSFLLSPMKQEIELKAGDVYEGSVLLANPEVATENFDFKVVVKPYSVTDEGYEPDFDTVSDWSKIVDWISIDEPTGTLSPNETKRIRFKITVPIDAPAGGQYAMIGVTSLPGADTASGNVHDTYTLASLIYAQIEGETIHSGEIIENYIPGFVSTGTPTTVATVANNGNVHEILTSDLKVKNVFTGQTIALTDEDSDSYESMILPDSTRAVSRSLEGLPGLGIFEVTQDLSYVGESSSVTTIMVICPIWFLVLAIITVTVIITTLLYKILKIFKKTKKSNKNQLHFDDANDKMEA